uniref:Bromo domain-containing protein n=1 Tax=Syphacia muris TaxID=451379 RepID=A0A0N5AP61_9BILA
MSNRAIIRKSDIGAPPARMSAGAPPILPVHKKAYRGVRGTPRSTPTALRKRKAEENIDVEESDSEPSTVAEDPEENESVGDEIKKEVPGEKVKKRKKRRFRLTDSIVKSKRRAERRAQLAAERKERAELGLDVITVYFMCRIFKNDDEGKKDKTSSPSPAPVVKPPMIRSYSPLQLLCDHLLRKLHAKDPEEYFAFPVTQAIAPDYHLTIKEPMDFSTMRMKIENNEYQDLAAFKHDLNLVVNNALEYNHPHTIYYVAAQKLEQIVNFYFSEPYLRYLYHSLPFCKGIQLEKMGLTSRVKKRPVPKVDRKAAIVDDATPVSVLNSVDSTLRQRLSSRKPNLKKLLPNTEDGIEPKCHLAFLDNKNGAVCLNVINSVESEEKVFTIGDLVGKLDEGNPGIFAPVETKSSAQVPISFLSYDPFSSFAPQFDSTWATLCERDSRLLLSTYGNRENVTNAISLRQMVENAGDHMIKIVDDILDTLTDGEHRRTISALETEKVTQPLETVDDEGLKQLLKDVESLENIGIDTSFIDDIRKLYGLNPPSALSVEDQMNKTGTMINDLALLQKNRLSSVPPTTVTNQPVPSAIELNLANKLQDQLHQEIAQFAKPADIISAPAVHNAVGLNEEVDLDLFNEFFTPAATTS